ncbi:MAG: DUF2934 domain-containing protein [Acidobacteriia bacterium]|nr:DUF2934 domain-containing protein [Terriglobia bacterium]
METKNSIRTRGAAATGRKGVSSVTRRSGPKRASAPDLTASWNGFTTEERHTMIAEAAYLKAESRAFQGGSPEQDWLDAEAEIDAILLQIQGGGE